MADKKKYGQYFTIPLIADFMTGLIRHPRAASRVLEPACGKGVFLDSLRAHGFDNVKAYEIDPLLKPEHECVEYSSFLSVPLSERYDVVIGNPPYIRWKNIEPELKKELEGNELWNKYFNSLCDYLFIFILKSIEHLDEGGELIFICTEYWLNTTHSATLRDYMCSKGYFAEIYHFEETPLFDKVTASFIIFRYIKTEGRRRRHIRLLRYRKDSRLPSAESLADRSCFDSLEIPQFRAGERWVLADEATQQSLRELEDSCLRRDGNRRGTLHRIGDYCDIGNGMVSGLDKAFQIKDETALNRDEREALIRVYKARNLSAYRNTGETKYIFLQKDISEDEFRSRYPHFAAHLEPFRAELAKRYCYGRDIPYWEFVFPRNQKLFERQEERIFIPCKERVSNKDFFRFCHAPADCYPTQDVTAIFKKDNCRESIEYILAYLNNERVFQWLKFNGIVKGAIVEFSEAPIASIPFRAINADNAREQEAHDIITEEVRAYLADGEGVHLRNINEQFDFLFND